MTDAPAVPAPLDADAGLARWLPWLVALSFVLAAFSPRDLWPPDEARYGQVAREMLEQGHWLVTHSNGQPDAEKPPLYYWLVASASAPLGRVTPWVARLVTALLAAACVPALLRLARAWFGDRRVGVTAVALFATNVLVTWNASRATLDLPLTCAILWAVERGDAWRRTGSVRASAAMGVAWAAAVLIKGPLGFLLPPAIVGAAIIAVGPRPPARNLGWLVAPLTMAGLCLAWLLPALAAGNDAYRARLLGQITGRITGGEGHHVRPWWYFLEVAPLFLAPVGVHLALGAWAGLRFRVARGQERAGLAAALVGGPLLFVLLSTISTKRELYLVPAVPFTALAGAWALHRGFAPRLARVASWALPLGLLAGALLVPALPWIERTQVLRESSAYGRALPWTRWLPLVPAALLLAWGAWGAWNRRAAPLAAASRAAVAWTLAWLVLALGHLPVLDDAVSFARVARAAEEAAGGGKIAVAGWYQAPNLLWNLDRAHIDEATVEDLESRLHPGNPRAAVVADASWWEGYNLYFQWVRAGPRSVAPRVREVWRDQVGSRVLIVLTNGDR